jgi:Tfp pilus assembly protein PilO
MLISDTGDLSGFYRSFPPETLILDITGQINQVAVRSGMGIAQAEYRANDDRSGMVRYEVTVSAHGTYPQLRTFTAECLTRFPTLSLEGLTLSRATVTDSAIDAQFRFSVYLRGI